VNSFFSRPHSLCRIFTLRSVAVKACGIPAPSSSVSTEALRNSGALKGNSVISRSSAVDAGDGMYILLRCSQSSSFRELMPWTNRRTTRFASSADRHALLEAIWMGSCWVTGWCECSRISNDTYDIYSPPSPPFPLSLTRRLMVLGGSQRSELSVDRPLVM
jgi:hypothetical protein